jgi:hypothetical protein
VFNLVAQASDFSRFVCHKTGKIVAKTLSKAHPRWYIPLAPDRLLSLKGMSSQDVQGMDRSVRPARPPGFVSRLFSQGAQRFIAGWSSPVARQAHNLKVASSNLAPATK